MKQLAQPHIRKDTVSRKNPFAVRKSAVTNPISPRMEELAKPMAPRPPVTRRKRRKKTKYGKPIIPVPVINDS